MIRTSCILVVATVCDCESRCGAARRGRGHKAWLRAGDTEKYVRQQSGRQPSFFSSVEGSAVGATRGASVDQHLSIHAVGA